MTSTDHLAIVDLGLNLKNKEDQDKVDTTKLFRAATGVGSPIDSFIVHTNAINLILGKAEDQPSSELASVVLLGYLSAVETYFRTLLSRLVHIDPATERLLETKAVTFSVARSRPREFLAESLYEDSFASGRELKSKLTEIGFQMNGPLEKKLQEYDKICHLRHCCVHRFGYLGTKNARDLGMREHGHLIGSVFYASRDDLEKIAAVLQLFVKEFNNSIWRFVTDRTVISQSLSDTPFDWKWSWDFKEDRKRFKPYYDLFKLVKTAPSTAKIDVVYSRFHGANLKVIEGIQKRAANESA
ncbi:hypothetical protein C8J34_10826 [Rhizobium sp. PP-F2F-G36]|nr:hypothetical protein C8J34_10826 [Rhizobium sp. PP-F2F-G36]